MYGSPFDDYPYDDGRYYDGPRQKHPDTEDRLRHVVYLDGRLIDTWTERVEGTAYHSWAQQLDRVVVPATLPPEEPRPAPHVAVLDWLDGVVGGRAALLTLDDRPLEPVVAPAEAGEEYAELEQLLDRVCDNLFADGEFRSACAAGLSSLWGIDPALLKGSPGEVAGALCWVVGRANGTVGAGTPVTQQALKRELWLKSGLTPKANKFRDRLRELLPSPGLRPASCPNLLELGAPAFLTSATRHELVRLRDRALDAAVVMEADEKARESGVAGPTDPPDSLMP